MRAYLSAFALAAGTALFAAPSHASGFLIYDLSGEGIGRASAVSADASEPAAGWFNPAGLAYSKGVNGSIGGVFVTARSSFKLATTGAETSSERGNFVLPALFADAKVSDNLSLGIGVYSAFGIGITWPYDWVGRESAISASLQTLAFNPNVALALSDNWSLAVGFDAIRGTVDFRNGLPSIVGGDVRLAGGAWGYGFNAAALYRAIPERLQFAVTYRSRVKLPFAGRADFTPANPDFSRALEDQPGTADITLPDIITVGVMARPTRRLTLGFDVNTVLWSTYEHVNIDFKTAPDKVLSPQGQTTYTVRGGVDFATPLRGLHARGGLIFDHGAIPSSGVGPALPDSNRIDVTMGLGYGRDAWKVDLGYMVVMFLPKDATTGVESPEGTYRTLAYLLGLTVGVHF
jgi:long-chain fatty acid transport protein